MWRYAMISILVFLIAPSVVLAQKKTVRNKTLTETTYAAILKTLRTPPIETHWSEIPWRPNFTEAIGDARREDKPILLWIMNGHPCGMT